jgi:hypothetical protein
MYDSSLISYANRRSSMQHCLKLVVNFQAITRNPNRGKGFSLGLRVRDVINPSPASLKCIASADWTTSGEVIPMAAGGSGQQSEANSVASTSKVPIPAGPNAVDSVTNASEVTKKVRKPRSCTFCRTNTKRASCFRFKESLLREMSRL